MTQPCQRLRGTAMQLVIVIWDCTCKVNLAAKHKQTFDDIKVLWPILMSSLKILTTRVKIVIIKEVIICYKVIKVKFRVRDGLYIYWSGIWYRYWWNSSTNCTTYSGCNDDIQQRSFTIFSGKFRASTFTKQCARSGK